MKHYDKQDFPLDQIRRFLEPGPIVLVSSAHKGERNLMTMGWHMMLGFAPARFGCYLWEGNHSYELIRRSGQCAINLPTADMVDTVVGIGNSSGLDGDKFKRFGLTATKAAKVAAPLVAECCANFECVLADASQIERHGLFIWDVVKAHVAVSPKRPQTLHYRGDGEFMVSGPAISRKAKFLPGNL
ncbi:flavin reductase family protein [Pseudoxanthomonas sp. CF125]|uniref:flavin reductase family protein n=1 Tax=Pseudoxanthomonas sp. CF125 TaxID=1855303 RepID=UPI000882BBA9|nr:flavin reductase family protein [Pseudoxanthomonas sp. CF125]SDR06277.1 NADH-FMN oxidoreductase RutF, flavin reductase (DIM6/NTAB) family [Pseudoxanthomonas sp. CF125]